MFFRTNPKEIFVRFVLSIDDNGARINIDACQINEKITNSLINNENSIVC